MAQYETVRRAGVGVQADIDAGLRAHMNKVYGLMSVAMVVTGLVAWAVGMDLKSLTEGGDTLLPPAMLMAMFTSPGVWIVIFAPLAVVLLLSARLHAMSTATAQFVFYLYAAMVGLSIATIFAVYTQTSIATTFFVTAIAFGSLSLYGYTTKKDLSGMGRFLMMGLFGLIAAIVVNMFVGSEPLQWAISVIGVLIFAGLTAWDTQTIKNEYLQIRTMPGGEAIAEKAAVSGALRLYLDFLNLFMFLLQFLGNRE